MDPLSRLFGSTARMKLLRLFVFNDDTSFTSTDAAFRAKVSASVARKEIANLYGAGLLTKRGARAPVYQANRRFEHYEPLRIFLRTTTSIKDATLVRSFKKVGPLRAIILSGLFTGALEPKVDILIVGDRIEDRVLKTVIHSLEAELGRELRYAAFSTPDFRYRAGVYDRLIRDVMDYPHRTILDRLGL